MNREKLEAWASRLYMLAYGYQIRKAQKAEALRKVKIRLTYLSEAGLIEQIEQYLVKVEVR